MASMTIAAGEFDIGRALIDGKEFIRVKVTATDRSAIVYMTFGVEHFVTVADHLKMVADELVDNRKP